MEFYLFQSARILNEMAEFAGKLASFYWKSRNLPQMEVIELLYCFKNFISVPKTNLERINVRYFQQTQRDVPNIAMFTLVTK